MTTMLIPASQAQIHWTTQERHMPANVSRVVVFNRFEQWPPEAEDEDLECSAGACCSDWLDGSDPRSTPEGVYAGWVQYGFKDEIAHVEALEQLARIEGCSWAGVIAAAMRLGQLPVIPFMGGDDADF